MSTRSDRLAQLNPNIRDRLNYVQGMLLDAASFGDEQLYHRGRLARALAYLFGTGTVAGLEASYQDADGRDEIEVTPGLCLDPLGRIIEVPQRWCVDLVPWLAAQRDGDLADGWVAEPTKPPNLIADVFVRFVACERRLSPAFASGPFDALDAVAPSRVRDAFEFGLVIRTEAQLRRAAMAAGPEPWPDLPIPGANERWEELLNLSPADRLAEMRADILAAWREGSTFWEEDRPPRLPEHLLPDNTSDGDDPLAVGRDTTSVLLARVEIPLISPVTGRPQRDTALAPTVHNEVRRFIYTPGILTQVLAGGGS